MLTCGFAEGCLQGLRFCFPVLQSRQSISPKLWPAWHPTCLFGGIADVQIGPRNAVCEAGTRLFVIPCLPQIRCDSCPSKTTPALLCCRLHGLKPLRVSV